MKDSKVLSLLFIMLLYIGVAMAQNNPVIKHPFTADPSIHQWSDGKFYIYGSHDKDHPKVWDMSDYHVFSSSDMVNWTDHGVVLENTETAWGGPFWAPDAAERDGRYYLYFPEGNNICVAECDTPTGPFTNPQIIYAMPEGYVQAYDPAVFEYEGEWYVIISERKSLTTSFYPVLFTLEENMTEIVEGSKVEITGISNFHEGPFIFFRNDKVYLIGGGVGTLRYWMADDITGPYDYKGDFFSGTLTHTISKTAHGSAIEVDGQWYLAAHYDIFPGDPYRRTTLIEYLNFNEDGTIIPVQPTMEGINPIVDTGILQESQVSENLKMYIKLDEKTQNDMPTDLISGEQCYLPDVNKLGAVYKDPERGYVRCFASYGAGANIIRPSSNAPASGNHARSIAFWAFVEPTTFTADSASTNQGNAQLFYTGNAGSEASLINCIMTGDKKIRILIGGAAAKWPQLEFFASEDMRNQWNHFVITIPEGASANDIKCYRNGESMGTPTVFKDLGGGTTENTTDLTLNTTAGTFNLGHSLTGMLSEFAFYDIELTDEQVKYEVYGKYSSDTVLSTINSSANTTESMFYIKDKQLTLSRSAFVKIYDVRGSVIMEEKNVVDTIDLSRLSGMYILSATTSMGETTTQQIVL